MSPSAIFRCSLVLSPAVGVAGAVYSIVAASHFSQDWQDLLAWNGDGAWLLAGSPEDIEDISGIEWLTVGALLTFILVAIINQIAMYFFWPPSRHIYAIVCVIGYGITPFFGLTVQPPLETLGYELSAFIAGVTLAMAYLPPVSARFARPDVGPGSAH